MKNILVFPCGSEIALDIYDSLKYSRFFKLFGGSSVDDHGKFVFENYISNFPFVTSPDFLSFLKNIVSEYKIDAIYPAMDLCLDIVKKIEDEIGCKVITSPAETTDICLSKLKTYMHLNNVVKCPRIYSIDNIEFPCFGKPEIGYGGIGTKLIENIDEAKDYIKESGKLLLEYLPGDEYTVDCFTDRNGKLLYSMARKRNRIKSGVSVNTFFVEDQKEFQLMAESINNSMKFRGAWFFQVKRDKIDKSTLMEVAARFGGSSNLSKAIGVNLPLLSLFDAFNEDIEILKNDYKVELDRALNNCYKVGLKYDTVYVDYDDCIIVDNKVNIEMITFLYKCLNKNKKIFLLSKHSGNLLKDLQIHKIDFNIFSGIMHINDDDDKSKYVSVEKSIFIDDSFKERKNIKEKLNIPVFGIDMISAL